MALKNKIDPETARRALTGWLRSRLQTDGEVEVRNLVVPSSSGLSCETILLDASWSEAGITRDHRLVARVAPAGEALATSLFPEYDLELEAQIMRALHDHTPVPTPNVRFTETDPGVLGGPFLLMERIDGRVPPDDPPYSVAGWVLDLDPAQQRTLVENAVRTIAALHDADWQGLGLQTVDRTDRGAPGTDQYIATVEHLYATGAGGRPHPTIDAGIAWVKANRPVREGAMVLNWGDTRIGNLIFADDLSVAGMLDWEMARIASRDQDLAHFLLNLDFFTVGFGAPSPPGFPSEAEVVALYAQISGHTPENLAYHKALSALMGAVVLMRVAYTMISAGLLPADSPMPHNNPGSQVMAMYMGLPAPSGSLTDWTGVR